VFKRAPGIALIALAFVTSAGTSARAQEPAESDEADKRPPRGVIGVVETDRPVRPSELPADTIPEVHPEDAAKGEPAPRTSASVARAPLPDQASGVSVGESRSTGEKLKFVPRALLFVPRLAVEVAGAPIRGGLYAYDRYEVSARARDIFWNDAGTVGLYPVFDIQTDYGLTGGARFIHRSLFGDMEKLSMRASFGGIYNQQYSASLTSGDRFGPLHFELKGEYEIDPRERFMGIGNGEEVADVEMPVDPYADPLAVDSRFRQRVARGFARARLRIVGPLSVRATSGLLRKEFERPSRGDIPPGTDIAEHYQVEELAAWEEGTSYSYNELELRYDSRRNGDEWEPISVPSTGWLISGFGGVARGYAGAPTRYTLYGGDVQRFIRIGPNPRVLTLRLMAQEIRGESEEIPFVDLPRLGGPTLLRGYQRDRFRDRALALGSAEYLWDLGRGWAGYLFTDAGRVYPRLQDAALEDIRVGFGGGVQLHSAKSYVGRINLASSIDGGIFFNLSLDPVYDPTARVERD
jgi:hypothetical protein